MDVAGRERVLVVDDEAQILVALEDLLDDAFTIVKAQTPERALALMAEDPNIAVVITDQRMPGMTGDELLRHFSKAPTVGILISGFADLPAVIRAINDGKVFAFVRKPWDFEDLRFKVAKGVERFRQARQIAHERQLLADLMNSSPDGIFFKANDLSFQRANRSFAQVLGAASPEAVIGRKLGDGLVAAGLAAAIEAEEETLIRTGEPILDVIREYESRDLQGNWYSETKAPIRGLDGDVQGLVAIVRNVSERRRTQEALRTSEEHLRQQSRILNSILDGIGEGVVVVDSSGRTLLFNSEAQRMLGAQAADVPPEQFAQAYDVYLPDGHTLVPASQNPLVRAMHGTPRVELEAIIKKKSAPPIRVSMVATPLRNDGGQVTGAITLLRDVTQTRNLEQSLVQSQKMEAVGQLAGGIAHDFNNLLAVIDGGGELALAELEGHAARDDVVEMVSASRRAATLTRQLLAFSRREPAQLAPVDLGDVVRDVEKLLRRLIGEHITLLTRLEKSAGLITADSNQMEQVLVNLCVNARDAMPQGGTLSIELRSLPEDAGSLPGRRSLALSVSDTGTGMAPELIERIFEPFFTTKEIGKGTGLGLSMVYGLVTQTGGQISVESSVGRGTTITIVFPVATPASAQLQSQQSRPRGPMGTAGVSILLVEDEPPVRHITARILRRQGYLVMEASLPSEARTINQTTAQIDLLLTDLIMPEMSGIKLADELVLARPGLKVLYMTGYADSTLHHGPNEPQHLTEHVIHKPFTARALLDGVSGVLQDSGRAT
jgi:two-component system, cell cycle sensor histidine kinase and response regulator CckA